MKKQPQNIQTLIDAGVDTTNLNLLYKRTSTGAIQVWGQEIQGNKYRSIIGQLEGKLQVSNWTTVKDKNVGKKNERLGNDQAKTEVEANYTKKVKEGYFESILDIDSCTLIKPMLALDWKDKYKELIDGEHQDIYLSVKLDGCLSKDTLVETEFGSRTLEEVYKSEDKTILSFNTSTNKKEMSNILGKYKNGVDISNSRIRWMKITLESGEVLKLTSNHLVFLPYLNIWRKAEDLTESDILLINVA